MRKTKKVPLLRRDFAFYLIPSVAGPGIAPGLEDYALVNLMLPRVSDYIISLYK